MDTYFITKGQMDMIRDFARLENENEINKLLDEVEDEQKIFLDEANKGRRIDK